MAARRPMLMSADASRKRAVNSTGPIAERPTVLLVVPLGRSARVLLHTAVASTLLHAGVRVVVLAPRHDMQKFREACGPSGDRLVFAAAAADEAERYHAFGIRGVCALVRSCVADGRQDLATLDNRLALLRARLRGRRPWQEPLVALAVGLLRRSGFLRRSWMAVETRWFVAHLHHDVFEQERPDLVVMATPGFDSPVETEALREACARGIPSAIVARGWDNPTAKGLMAATPSHFFAWTDVMRDEWRDYHGIDPARVDVTGAPYLDVYATDQDIADRAAFLNEVGLDPARKTIVYAAKLPVAFRGNVEVITALAEAVRDDRFAVSSQLLVRLYPPKARRTGELEELAACRRIVQSFPHVALSVPDLPDGESRPGEATRHFGGLRAMLEHGDVLVNVFSTMAIEAALHDLPVVNIGYDSQGPKALPTEWLGRSVRLHERETHNRRLASHRGDRTVRSASELIAEVNAYLLDPSRDAAGRRRIVEHEVGPNHGRAGVEVGLRLAALALQARTTASPAERVPQARPWLVKATEKTPVG